MPSSSARRILVLLLSVMPFLFAAAHAQAPYGFHFVATGQSPSSVIYDSFHKCFYVAVPGTSQVYVVSAGDGSVTSTIDIFSAYGLDLSPDGTRLYVTSSSGTFGFGAAEGFYLVNTSSLKVIDFVQPTVPVNPIQTNFPNQNDVPRFIAAMRNGKIFYNAEQRGVTGSQVFAFDPVSGISTAREPITGSASFYEGIIRKSAGGSKFAILSGDSAGGDLWVYDSNSDTYSAYARVLVNTDAVVNPGGTRVLAGGHLLFDQNLNLITDLASGAQLNWQYFGAAFSPDGTKVYVEDNDTFAQTASGGTTTFSNPVVSVFSGDTGQLLGYVPAPRLGTLIGLGMAVSDNGLGILLTDQGFAEIDLSKPNSSLPGPISEGLLPPNTVMPPVGSPQNPAAAMVGGSGFRSGAKVFFGANAAPSATVASSNLINVQPPPGNPGPIDVTVYFPDGWALYGAQAYTYGPTVLYQDVNAGDVNGGTTVQLIGYGFDSKNSHVAVTVGGMAATVTNVNLLAGISPFSFPIEHITFVTPRGIAGPADITVTTDTGSTTVQKGFRYISHQLISGVLPLQMAVDESRNRLYVADYSSGDVKFIDLNSMAVGTLVSSSGNPAVYLTMTPDTSNLLIVGATGMLTVFNLNSASVVNRFYASPGNQPSGLVPTGIVSTSRGTAIVSMTFPGSFGPGSGGLFEIDLATGNATAVLQNADATLLAASADGNWVYMADAGSGDLRLWSASADAIVRSLSYAFPINDLATTSSGDRLLEDSYVYTPLLSLINGVAPNDLLVSQRSVVEGEKIHSSGSLVYLPTTKGVEIYDVHHGQMSISVGILGGVASTVDGLVTNHAGTMLFVAEQAGIGIIDLSQAPLSIGSVSPAQGNASGGNVVTLSGSGFSAGASVTIDGQPVAAQVAGSTILTFTVPPISSAKVAVTVTNPNGDTYTLDAAYDASVHSGSLTPVLTSLSPLIVTSGDITDVTIVGSNFDASSDVMLNGQPVQTVYVSGQEVVAYLYSVPGPGLDAITVVNAAPGGTSNTLNLKVHDASPFVNSLSPSPVVAGTGAFELNVTDNGTFRPNSVVLWNGSPRPTSYVSLSQLIAQITAADIAATGTATITVTTATATPSTSNSITLNIVPPVAQATIQTSSIPFGPQLIGTLSPSVNVTITSSGNVPLVISSVTLSDTVNFRSATDCPTSLAVGNNCALQIAFAPSASSTPGPVSANVSINDNSSSSPEKINLTGQALDYRVQSNPTNVSVTAGQSAKISLSLIAVGANMSDPLQVSCQGLPAGAVCSFDQLAPVPTAGGTAVNLTISTTGKAGTSIDGSVKFLFALALPGLLALSWALSRGGRRDVLGVMLLFLALVAVGCSSGGATDNGSPAPPSQTNQTPAGTYAITITAADGLAQRTAGVSLTVTAP
jgi:hypothetical protein